MRTIAPAPGHGSLAHMRTTRTRVWVALLLAGVGVSLGHPTAHAEGHQVTYTITTTSDLNANIQYIETDPPSRSAYDADAARYLKTIRTPIAGGQPLVYSATLVDPGKWALVTASGGLRINPEFHCEIAVDGTVVVSQQGGSGVTCSTQPW